MLDFAWLLYVALISLDLVLLSDLKSLVYSFLLGKRNTKRARKIHQEQRKFDKLTLAYIADYTERKKAFCIFQKLWVINMLAILPQYASIVICHFLRPTVALILVIVFLALKIVLNVIVSAQFNAKRFSKYDRRHNLK